MDEHVVLRAKKYRNLTQAELANIVGTDRARISKIESGNANPSVAQLAKIANAMDMTLQIKFIPKETEGRDYLEF